MVISFDTIIKEPLPAEVLEAMLPYFKEQWGTPVLAHRKGSELHYALESALTAIYKLAKAPREDYYLFTSSGAEAVNHAIFSAFVDITQKTGKNHFITSTCDEAPAILALTRLKELGCHVDFVTPNEKGIVTPEAIGEALTPRTALVALSSAHALTGVLQPIDAIASVLQERGVWLHVDATHTLGKTPYACAWDSMSFNGEQLPAPAGTGGLFVRAKHEFSPFILGGNEQGGLRGGSFNVPAFVGLGKGATLARSAAEFFPLNVGRLRDLLEESLLAKIPGSYVHLKDSPRLPHVTALHFPHVTSDALAYLLQRKKLFTSLGGGNFQKIYHLLKDPSALGFSLSRYTQEVDVLKAIDLLTETYFFLRKCYA